jgi:hypothetical protein
MRPASIVTFGRLWLLSILLSIAGAWVSRVRVQAMLEANPQSAPIAHWALPTLTGVVALFCLLLWYMVVHRSLTGKWGVLIVAILGGLRALVTLINLMGSNLRHPVSSLLTIAAAVVAIIAAALLFRAEAREWFGEIRDYEGGVTGPGYTDPELPS